MGSEVVIRASMAERRSVRAASALGRSKRWAVAVKAVRALVSWSSAGSEICLVIRQGTGQLAAQGGDRQLFGRSGADVQRGGDVGGAHLGYGPQQHGRALAGGQGFNGLPQGRKFAAGIEGATGIGRVVGQGVRDILQSYKPAKGGAAVAVGAGVDAMR